MSSAEYTPSWTVSGQRRQGPPVWRAYDIGAGTYELPCFGCGRPVTLWFNGGELDTSECCGRVYALVGARYDVTVT